MRRLRLLLILALAAVLLAACQVDTQVRIDVDEGGSGAVTVTVELDREAAQRLGDPATSVRLDDLRAAGWTVEDPATDTDSGALTYRATREFASPEALATVLAEVGGGDSSTGGSGVFRDVRLQVVDGFATTTYSFSSGVVLTGTLAEFSDADLTAALGGLALARTPEELAADGANDPEAAQLEVVVSLPGDVSDSNGDVEEVPNGQVARWEFPLTGGIATDATMTSASSVGQRGPVLLVGLGVAALALALVAGGVALVRRRA